MYVRWTTFRCPTCNARTESRIVTSPRVGVEYKKCRSCGAVYRTPDIEWQHMTTGLRIGYFLNEWTVAVLGLSVLSAFAVYYNDKSDWQTIAWVLAVPLACCVPFWLFKYLMVRYSIARTNAMNAHDMFGDVRGLDNISQVAPFHSESARSPSRTYDAPTKSSAISRGWKIRLVIFGLFIVVGILDSQWKTVDKYFPALNKVLHSGTPTSEDDMDYLIGHLQADEQKLSEGCPEKMPFKECRQRILLNKPALDDLHGRIQGLNVVWSREKSERTVPAACRSKMDELLHAYDQYLAAEDKIFALLQSMDSPERLKDSQTAFDEAANNEDVAVNALHQADVGKVCDGY